MSQKTETPHEVIRLTSLAHLKNAIGKKETPEWKPDDLVILVIPDSASHGRVAIVTRTMPREGCMMCGYLTERRGFNVKVKWYNAIPCTPENWLKYRRYNLDVLS